jgi:AcrR family transcriptional regulator
MESLKEPALHPTAQKLVDTVIEMLKTTPYNSIKSENVLMRSEISRGPLYHHFSNFEELIETAQTQIFLASVAVWVTALANGIETSADADCAREQVRILVASESMKVTIQQLTQGIGIIHNASSIEPLHQRLGKTQEKLTQEWMMVYQLCVDKGWADPKMDARSVAVLVQAAFTGRILDNLSSVQMKSDDWVQVLLRLFDGFFFCTALANQTQS